MRLRFILALLILFFACAMQFWFASAGVFINFILAALIVFAFFFNLLELIVFILAAVFIVNWQPAASIDIIVFALIPVAAYAFRRASRWTAWAGAPVAVVAGFLVLYIALAPFGFSADALMFATDVFGGLVFAILALIILERLGRA